MNTLYGLCHLKQFAFIQATGRDAVAFMHSQLTHDIQRLDNHHATLAAYCTPKGRMLSDCLLWKTQHEEHTRVWCLVPEAVAANILKRLRMFVLRAQVTLELVTHDLTLVGAVASTEYPLPPCVYEAHPTLPPTPYSLTISEQGVLIQLKAVLGYHRYLWVIPKPLQTAVDTLSLPINQASEEDWLRLDIHAGIPHITLATQEKWVPQMINYDLIDGISFKKGCYPGQEIVARTHYLGKQKRRMLLARIDYGDVHSGMEVFTPDNTDEPCGMIVNAIPNDTQGVDCLIEIKLAYASQHNIQLATGHLCHWLRLPYVIPEIATDSLIP